MSIDFDPRTLANIFSARTVRGVPPDVYMQPFAGIADMLETQARLTPDKLYLIAYDDTGARTTYTYAQFAAWVDRMAGFLVRECGVRRGDRVATVAYNHPDTVIAYFACWKIGATVVPQNVGEDDARIAFILRNAGAQVVLARPEYLERVERIRIEAPGVRQVVAMGKLLRDTLDQEPAAFAAPDPPDLEDEGLLVYTSGTTGPAKGVQLTQYNLLVDARGIVDWHGLDADQRTMCVLPIHHVNGMVVTLITPMFAGASTVLNRGFSVTAFWRRLAEERVSIVSVVPTLLQFLLEADEDIGAYDLSRFRHLICGAGTLPIALAERFEQRFGMRIIHGYGLSETTAYACFLPVDLSAAEYKRWMRDFGYPSIGTPIEPNEITIQDAEGRELPDGEKGEIVIRGHNVMVGYFQRPDANAETFKHGWFRSGDEGFRRLDERGRPFFFISGRLKELINRGGVKYSPFEIEEVLLRMPGVRVGLAVAFDNLYYGEEVGAYVVPEEGAQLTEQAVLAHCRAHMPFPKAPKVVVFGTDIPATATGKYQRLMLKERFSRWADVQFKELGASKTEE